MPQPTHPMTPNGNYAMLDVRYGHLNRYAELIHAQEWAQWYANDRNQDEDRGRVEEHYPVFQLIETFKPEGVLLDIVEEDYTPSNRRGKKPNNNTKKVDLPEGTYLTRREFNEINQNDPVGRRALTIDDFVNGQLEWYRVGTGDTF